MLTKRILSYEVYKLVQVPGRIELAEVNKTWYLGLLYAWQNYCILIGWEEYNYFIIVLQYN